MFKKIFLNSLITNFFFTKKIFAAESGGMPQLDPEFWISQIFWLVLTFGFLYIVLSKLILPKISANLELRKSQIQENIEAAEKQRESSEAKIKEFDQNEDADMDDEDGGNAPLEVDTKKVKPESEDDAPMEV